MHVVSVQYVPASIAFILLFHWARSVSPDGINPRRDETEPCWRLRTTPAKQRPVAILLRQRQNGVRTLA